MLNAADENAPEWSYGYTNDQGQIVLSSHDLNGIHAVHGGKQVMEMRVYSTLAQRISS